MRRVCSIGLLLALLGGCTSSTQDVNNIKKEREVINVLKWDGEREIFEKINHQFEKETGIEVQCTYIKTELYPNYLKLALEDKKTDIVAVDPFGQFVNKYPGILEKEPFVDLTNEEFIKNYSEEAIGNNVVYKEKVLAMPLNMNAATVFYNKDLFNELNLEVPRTYEEFLEVCEVIKDNGMEPLTFGGKETWPLNIIFAVIEPALVRYENQGFYDDISNGNRSFISDEFINALKVLKEVSAQWDDKSLGILHGDAIKNFTEKKSPMYIDATWALQTIILSGIDFELGTFTFPSSNVEERNEVLPVKYGLQFSVKKDSKNKENSLKYLEFLSREDIYSLYINDTLALPTQDNIELKSKTLINLMESKTDTIEFFDQIWPNNIKIETDKIFLDMLLNNIPEVDIAKKFQDSIVK